MLKNLRKVIQKRVYDVLSHKYGIFMVIAAAVILIVAALHFGEVRMCLFLNFPTWAGALYLHDSELNRLQNLFIYAFHTVIGCDEYIPV